MTVKKLLPMFVGFAAMTLAVQTARADVFFDYADIRIDFDAGTSRLSVTENTATIVKASLRDIVDTPTDRADIGMGMFGFLLDALIVDGAGTDDLSLAGTMEGTDKTTGTASYSAAFSNTAFGSDMDGVTWSGGTLAIRGRLNGIGGSSILVGPAGDWVFEGTSDMPLGAGLDGLSDQFTVEAADRVNYTTGSVFVLETSIPVFRDGTSTSVAGDAEAFFAEAALHGGFMSDGGDMKVSVIPAPGAAFLGMAGFGFVGWVRRRIA